ncbi:glycosyltransferase family 4 protein [Synechococcus sp. CBW1004]|uniref:glycosyltransferase family 4 protein n=1 Tax=Synechococcus sp. CBW1004 TaxID=1353136 RepID=UPI0018CFBD69|nr:glycosyltransferase family 4 protein [Synechococcus sp. CBW1004]QPN63428.1 glycosyltransferase family 4 protein [Synechococcus sp. CBW1004]
MRILLISDYSTPSGGAELMTLSLRKQLRFRGHDVRLFASNARPIKLQPEADYSCFGTLSSIRGITQVLNPSAYNRLRQILKEFRPDVIHVRLFLSQLSPFILPLLKDTPAIYHVAWYRCICPIGTKLLPDQSPCQENAGIACIKNRCFPAAAWPSAMAQLSLWRLWSRNFSLIVANSYATQKKLLQYGIQADEVIWNGVPVHPYDRQLNQTPTVAFAGRLVTEKGVDDLLDAMHILVRRIPAASLLVAGDGPERKHLEARARRIGIGHHVVFLGHLSRLQLEERLKGAWVQVVPSRWEEPFGIVAAEAMMRGTAVLATNSGGLNEIIQDHETGLLVPANDPQSLAEALTTMLLNPRETETLGTNGRNFALRRLTEAGFVDRFEQLYAKLKQ